MPGHLFEGNPVDEGTTKGALTPLCIVWKNPQVLQRGLAPRSKGKARAELRTARRPSRLPHSRSLLLPGRER